MTLIITGIFLWITAFAALARIGCLVITKKPTKAVTISWLVLLLFTTLLLFRPHEDITGGQDNGAYINFGSRLARQPELIYTDEILSQVPAETRADFLYYSHGRSYLSKFACGVVRDLNASKCSVWFQPAFPILMSIPAKILSSKAVLFVTPVFALFTALALAGLLSLLIKHPFAGIAAFALYSFNPLILWHARCPRPEIVASFFLFSGACLLIAGCRAKAWENWQDIMLGSLCISMAPFFHITAWMLVLPAAALIFAILIVKRTDLIIYPAVAVACFCIFIFQTYKIVDTYGIFRKFIGPAASHPIALIIFIGLFVIASLAISIIARKKGLGAKFSFLNNPKYIISISSIIMCLYVGCYIIAKHTRPEKVNQAYHYIYRTDMVAVLNMISTPLAILALIGLIIFATRNKDTRTERWALLFFAIPATLTIGNMYDFFMTRYMMVSLMPVMVIGLTGLITIFPVKGREGKAFFIAFLSLILIIGLHNRQHLAETVELKGFTKYLQTYADKIKEDDGILLAEYSRIATPFDHFFGIPTLGLHNEREDNYDKMEKAWKIIETKNPGRPSFFITPYQKRKPSSKYFDFAPSLNIQYKGSLLLYNRWALPEKLADYSSNLQMYKMLPKGSLKDSTQPYTVAFDSGNMGLRKFANCRDFDIKVPCVEINSDNTLKLNLPDSKNKSAKKLLIFCLAEESSAHPGEINIPGKWIHLADRWWLYEAAINNTLKMLELKSADKISISGIRMTQKDHVSSVFDASSEPNKIIKKGGTVSSRWARSGAEMIIPTSTGSAGGYIYTFSAGPEEVGSEVTISLKTERMKKPIHKKIHTGTWMWDVWPVSSEENQAYLSVTLDSNIKFNPKHPRYPEDLAILMGYTVYIKTSADSLQ